MDSKGNVNTNTRKSPHRYKILNSAEKGRIAGAEEERESRRHTCESGALAHTGGNSLPPFGCA